MLLDQNTKKWLIVTATGFLLVMAVVWFFFLNKGTLEIAAEPPYLISVAPKGGEKQCNTEICKMSLPAHTYTVTVSKKGYYAQSKEIEVWRGKNEKVSFKLTFIPLLIEKSENFITALPETIKHHNLSDVFPGARDFSENFLKSLQGVSEAFFVQNGEYALLTISGKKYIANTKSGERKKAVLPRYEDIVWTSDGDFLYFLEEGKGTGLQRLSRYSRESGNEEVMVYFQRKISPALLSLSDDETALVVIDKGTDPESLYVIDLEKKSRERVLEAKNIVQASVSPTKKYIVYEANGLWIFDREKWLLTQGRIGAEPLSFATTLAKSVWTKGNVPLNFGDDIFPQQWVHEDKDVLIAFTEEGFIRFWPENGKSEVLWKRDPKQNIQPTQLFLQREGVYFVSEGKVFVLQLVP